MSPMSRILLALIVVAFPLGEIAAQRETPIYAVRLKEKEARISKLLLIEPRKEGVRFGKYNLSPSGVDLKGNLVSPGTHIAARTNYSEKEAKAMIEEIEREFEKQREDMDEQYVQKKGFHDVVSIAKIGGERLSFYDPEDPLFQKFKRLLESAELIIVKSKLKWQR